MFFFRRLSSICRRLAQNARRTVIKRFWVKIGFSLTLYYYVKGYEATIVKFSNSKYLSLLPGKESFDVWEVSSGGLADFFDQMETGHPYIATLAGVVASDGGLPIIESGKVIGAIGISGGSGPQDGVIAKAGADSVK